MALSISSLQRGVPAKFPEVPVGEVPFGGNARRGKCQLGDRFEKFNPWTDDFFPILYAVKI